MDFTNDNVPVQNLPAAELVPFQPLESDYLKARRISMAITALIIAIILFLLIFFITELQTTAIISSTVSVFLLLLIMGYIADSIGFRYSGYAIRDKDILFRRGWLIHKIRVVPLNRVQHVSVQSGPIERKFGLSSVSIFTAGAGTADLTIRGITEITAQQIKEWISNQLNEPVTQ